MSETTSNRLAVNAADIYSFPRSLFRRFVHWASYHFILKSRRTRRVTSEGLDLVVPPSVFHPGVFVTSRMFARFAGSLDLSGKTIVEVGTGSGIIAIAAARAGAAKVLALDINPDAVMAARQNADANGVGSLFSARLSDLFSATTPDETFDVILSSPPSFEGEPRDMADRAWLAGPGYRDIRLLFEQARDHLNKDGAMYVLLSSDTNVRYLQSIAADAGFVWQLVAHKSIVVESFLIYCLTRREAAAAGTSGADETSAANSTTATVST